jgi:hypothetical protein
VNVGRYPSAAALQQVPDMQMEEGISMTLDRLDDLLAELGR